MFLRLISLSVLASALFSGRAEAGSCVWKVTAAGGHVLYLGGSIHALRPSDYPLPSAYNRAFDASIRLVFEVDPKTLEQATKELVKAGQYPKGDSLKNHVDPRTYDYLRRFFAIRNVPMEKVNSFRPWMIDLLLTSASTDSFNLGVERFLQRRAAINSKPISGLESRNEHNRVFVGLNDHESEALLLVLFINAGLETTGGFDIVKAWRRGDADSLTRMMDESFRDLPAMGARMLEARNRAWMPKIEGFLRSGQTYFVVVGAAHLGGPNGLIPLLRARGCRLEQL